MKLVVSTHGKMVMKHASLGAVGFGGIAVVAAPIVYDGSRAEIQLVMLAVPVIAGILGPVLLRLKRRTIIIFEIVSLIVGLLGPFMDFSRGDIEDLVPFFVAVFLAGGAGFGAVVGHKRSAAGEYRLSAGA